MQNILDTVIKYQNSKMVLIHWAGKRIGDTTLGSSFKFLGPRPHLLYFLYSQYSY